MKAIEYSAKISTKMINLIYSTCTNDLIVNSKQNSIIENYLLAFFCEFNRLFIADSLLMKALQKHINTITTDYLDAMKTFYNTTLINNKEAFLELFNTNIRFDKLNKMRIYDNFSEKSN